MKRPSIPIHTEQLAIHLEAGLIHDLHSICNLLGTSKDDVVAEALEEWIECIAPVRLRQRLTSQNEKKSPSGGICQIRK